VSQRDPWALVNVLVLSAAVSVVVGAWVLVDLHGWSYYTTPLGIRGYAAPHRALRPSGSVAHPLGVVGLLMLVVPVLYVVRKRWSRLSNAGSMHAWLEVHIFCGIVGPMLVTFHTAMKFNGLISVAYWSMMTVMLSGFVGRYLFVRIPKTIRGTELTREDIAARADAMKARLAETALAPALLDRVLSVEDRLEPLAVASLLGPMTVRSRLRGLRHDLRAAGVDRGLSTDVTEAMAERLLLLRRLARLQRTKVLFSMWHVFHQPLVYLMFGIALVHVGVAVYLGYAF
jgi:hypothetical protein